MNRLRLQYLADKLKISLSGHWVLVVCSVITLLICLLHALYAGCYSDFSPINGTFQNFNPIRRLLSRQIPYQDFIDYLGLGHLYLGSLMTFIFGGDYQSSLIAFRFLSIFSLASIFLSLGYAISQRYIVSVTFTNIVLVALTITLPFVHSIGITNELTNALNLAFRVGNSARYVRGMILPLTIIFILLLVLKLQSPPPYRECKGTTLALSNWHWDNCRFRFHVEQRLWNECLAMLGNYDILGFVFLSQKVYSSCTELSARACDFMD